MVAFISLSTQLPSLFQLIIHFCLFLVEFSVHPLPFRLVSLIFLFQSNDNTAKMVNYLTDNNIGFAHGWGDHTGKQRSAVLPFSIKPSIFVLLEKLGKTQLFYLTLNPNTQQKEGNKAEYVLESGFQHGKNCNCYKKIIKIQHMQEVS